MFNERSKVGIALRWIEFGHYTREEWSQSINYPFIYDAFIALTSCDASQAE